MFIFNYYSAKSIFSLIWRSNKYLSHNNIHISRCAACVQLFKKECSHSEMAQLTNYCLITIVDIGVTKAYAFRRFLLLFS